MKQPAYFGLALGLAFNSVLLVWGSPSFSIAGFTFGSDTFENEEVNSKMYNIITSVTEKKGKCMRHIRVTGNGIGDTFDTLCSANGVFSTILPKILIYGHPKEDTLSLFSDEPSVLIVFQDGKCTKRTYKTEGRKTTKDTSTLSEEECKQIQNKVMYIEDQESKYLEALNKHHDDKSATNNNFKFTTSSKSGGNSHNGGSHSSVTTSSKPKKTTESSQFVQGNKLESVLETHQQLKDNGITVTEQAAAPSTKDSSLKSAPNKKVDLTTREQHSYSHSTSYHNYLDSKLKELKSKISSHLTHKKKDQA